MHRPSVDLHEPVLARDVLESAGEDLVAGAQAVGLDYAGLRPEEAVAAALPDCRLPRTGWGRLIVHRTLPQAGKRWTDTGRNHGERGLKNRPPGETRVVPLPPHLVALWREHVAAFGTADDGRLFFSERGGVLAYTTHHRVWHETRALALPPALTNTPLAKRRIGPVAPRVTTWVKPTLSGPQAIVCGLVVLGVALLR